MERLLILVFAALMVFVAPGIQGTSHLSFANNTQVSINRTGCMTSKLCVETPDSCDPAGNSSCLFVSVAARTPMPPNGTVLSVELRGDSKGYIALGLTSNPSEGSTMLFICAQNSSNNGSFFFRTMARNNTNGTLMPTETRVSEIRSLVEGNVIRCEFDIQSVNATMIRASPDTTFAILLGSGPVVGDSIGDFNVTLSRTNLDLTNPAANTAATAATTVMMTTGNMTAATGAAGPFNAVLPLLSGLTLLSLLRV